jgi:hypothetical protein
MRWTVLISALSACLGLGGMGDKFLRDEPVLPVHNGDNGDDCISGPQSIRKDKKVPV